MSRDSNSRMNVFCSAGRAGWCRCLPRVAALTGGLTLDPIRRFPAPHNALRRLGETSIHRIARSFNFNFRTFWGPCATRMPPLIALHGAGA
ncbi:hypothetical protein CBM2605_A110082 [Cupriavidus neocaledonicus]|uniref:Transposase n=1 Tax=Cupriavidus neocaledonicus TaxID=1040979 RepID=A0ABY1UZE6_9BURK|nr:hypothetical protein CBM2605_A110082 [Cupriavidus neocaledonicus]